LDGFDKKTNYPPEKPAWRGFSSFSPSLATIRRRLKASFLSAKPLNVAT
jgi:hypothetical protein